MKRIWVIFLFLIFNTLAHGQIVTDSVCAKEVKSVFLTPEGNELARPCIAVTETGGQSSQLLLRFDLLGHENPFLRYRIRHCTADWMEDDLDPSEYLTGPADATIDNYQFSFTTLQPYVNYYQQIPGSYNGFTLSGNYALEVYLADEPDSVLLVRRFWVYEESVSIETSVGKPVSGGDLFADQELTVAITPNEGSFLPLSSQYYRVEVQQNRRRDLCRELPFGGYEGNKLMYRWKSENVFPGGNCFRYFDMSSLRTPMYHVQRLDQWGDEHFAFLAPDEDRSRRVYVYNATLNGGMKMNVADRNQPHIEGDYAWVTFSLPMQRPFLDGSIHVVGDLTDWRLDSSSRMEWQPQYKAYTARFYLKQGYYAYQLLFLPAGERQALSATLEGDHVETPNSYSVFVYYRLPGARYDRLVGVK